MLDKSSNKIFSSKVELKEGLKGGIKGFERNFRGGLEVRRVLISNEVLETYQSVLYEEYNCIWIYFVCVCVCVCTRVHRPGVHVHIARPCTDNAQV